MKIYRVGAVLILGCALVVPSAAVNAAESVGIGDCLAVEDAWSPTAAYDVVDCAEEHNGEVYDIVAYPEGAGAPSTLDESQIAQLEESCSWEAFDDWLGAEINLPLAIWRWYISVPSDDAWGAGDRDVLCRTVRPTAKYDAMTYTGAIPELFSASPLLDWLTCTTKAPKSGKPNNSSVCTGKSKWLLLGGAPVKGKVTGKYPKDLQKAADKACSPLGKKYGKKGTKPAAALLPKKWIDPSNVFTECFIPVKSWNGKG